MKTIILFTFTLLLLLKPGIVSAQDNGLKEKLLVNRLIASQFAGDRASAAEALGDLEKISTPTARALCQGMVDTSPLVRKMAGRSLKAFFPDEYPHLELLCQSTVITKEGIKESLEARKAIINLPNPAIAYPILTKAISSNLKTLSSNTPVTNIFGEIIARRSLFPEERKVVERLIQIDIDLIARMDPNQSISFLAKTAFHASCTFPIHEKIIENLSSIGMKDETITNRVISTLFTLGSHQSRELQTLAANARMRLEEKRK